MPSQVLSTTENNFTKGLVTEFTGLNFPENAATDADNSTFTLIGDVTRRLGIDRETNFLSNTVDRTGLAINTYEWNNVGGDGHTQILASQVGSLVYFFSITSSTIAAPISNQILVSTINLSSFVANGGTLDNTIECQFTSGNGYLFIFHPSCDPIYCIYTAGTVAGNSINVQTRDFIGIFESGVADNFRSSSLTDSHNYNIQNQGWVSKAGWSSTSVTSNLVGTGPKTWSIQTGLTISPGDTVSIVGISAGPGFEGTSMAESGLVTAYNSVSGELVVSVTSSVWPSNLYTSINWTFVHPTSSYITTWQSAVNNYPSNADIWWRYKDTTGAFAPATTIDKVTLQNAPAPKGHYILSAFNQDRTTVSSISNLTSVSTLVRPKTGTWFQGRVWYAGVDAAFAATGTAPYSTWTESIYFSQIIQSVDQFGKCYQLNDPTDQDFFDLLPTDGGVIIIQGSGSIYKLFPIQNGMLVFAANGIWFITGSQGIGFSANDYTITKISAIKSISSTSYVDVQGLPYFWNEDGIYSVQPSQQGGLTVTSTTYTTIDSYFADIPLSSKKYARGDYDPINYTIKWIFKDTEATDVTDRYAFNKVLNYNNSNKAFYPYTVDIVTASLNSINYISGPGGSTCPPPAFKHIATVGTSLSFADEHNTNYVDWHSIADTAYTSSFTTGYKVHGQGLKRFQLPYLYVYSRTNGASVAYKVQGIWDYGRAGNSGKWSAAQMFSLSDPNFDVIFRRVKIRGQGLALQIRFESVSGQPFDFIGWSSFETANTGV